MSGFHCPFIHLIVLLCGAIFEVYGSSHMTLTTVPCPKLDFESLLAFKISNLRPLGSGCKVRNYVYSFSRTFLLEMN